MHREPEVADAGEAEAALVASSLYATRCRITNTAKKIPSTILSPKRGPSYSYNLLAMAGGTRKGQLEPALYSELRCADCR
jgi:hypothetical protein